MDRLITITLEHYDRETEVLIGKQKFGLPKEDAERIVDMVRELRMFGVNNHRPTIRAGIAGRTFLVPIIDSYDGSLIVLAGY